jgi:hypothetical protein
MKANNLKQLIKRKYERTGIGYLTQDMGIDWCEEKMPGFWDIIAEYFTAE